MEIYEEPANDKASDDGSSVTKKSNGSQDAHRERKTLSFRHCPSHPQPRFGQIGPLFFGHQNLTCENTQKSPF